MKIILLGYMASGKSTIGKNIAKKHDIDFIDLDEYIEKKEGKTISKIFEEEGEIYFRRKENEYLKEVLDIKGDYLLSLGGGTPCYANNMELITTSNAISIYLKATPNTIVKRLKNEKEQRPLVASLNNEELLEFVAKHLFERGYYYSKATHSITIDDENIESICTKIYSLLT